MMMMNSKCVTLVAAMALFGAHYVEAAKEGTAIMGPRDVVKVFGLQNPKATVYNGKIGTILMGAKDSHGVFRWEVRLADQSLPRKQIPVRSQNLVRCRSDGKPMLFEDFTPKEVAEWIEAAPVFFERKSHAKKAEKITRKKISGKKLVGIKMKALKKFNLGDENAFLGALEDEVQALQEKKAAAEKFLSQPTPAARSAQTVPGPRTLPQLPQGWSTDVDAQGRTRYRYSGDTVGGQLRFPTKEDTKKIKTARRARSRKDRLLNERSLVRSLGWTVGFDDAKYICYWPTSVGKSRKEAERRGVTQRDRPTKRSTIRRRLSRDTHPVFRRLVEMLDNQN